MNKNTSLARYTRSVGVLTAQQFHSGRGRLTYNTGLNAGNLGKATELVESPKALRSVVWKNAAVTELANFDLDREHPNCSSNSFSAAKDREEKYPISAAEAITSSELVRWFAADQNSAIPASCLLDVVTTLAGGHFLSTTGLGSGLIEEFGSIGGVLAADANRLRQWLEKNGEPGWFAEQLSLRLSATAALMRHALAEEVQERPLVSSWQKLLKYLKIVIRNESIEHSIIIFLDNKNYVIKDEMQQKGTVDHTPLYPREVAKRSLELGASAIIMVHNHPSGDLTPSRADIEMTKQVEAALAPLRVTLHDHLIIGKGGHMSFKTHGLI